MKNMVLPSEHQPMGKVLRGIELLRARVIITMAAGNLASLPKLLAARRLPTFVGSNLALEKDRKSLSPGKRSTQ